MFTYKMSYVVDMCHFNRGSCQNYYILSAGDSDVMFILWWNLFRIKFQAVSGCGPGKAQLILRF